MLVGHVDKFVKPTSTEGDQWSGKKLMTISAAIKQLENSMKTEHENIYSYKIAQLTILKMLFFAQSSKL